MRFRSRVASVVGVLGLVAGTVASGSTAVLAAPAGAGSSSVKLVTDPAAHVNPFIGTGSGGQVVGDVDTFPGADYPFGMIQWSPDTSPDRTDGGGASITCRKTSRDESAQNGGRPVSSSKRMAPRLYTSTAVLRAVFPLACSGDM